jgi:hypothetical protein
MSADQLNPQFLGWPNRFTHPIRVSSLLKTRAGFLEGAVQG